MWTIIQKGGPIMWPLLLTSLIALTVVIERCFFIIREKKRRSQQTVNNILDFAEKGELEKAVQAGKGSEDFVARTMVYGLTHREKSFSSALLQAANLELKRFSQGLPTLDTIITLAPLLGLLGTVTGMIRAFGLLGQTELEAPTVITGGIAEALIATAFGLGIAIIALIPFNYLNARLEEARHEIEDASTHLELSIRKPDRRFL
ncbi:MAG: MotA/TolQ/ExbB proton channel family protein [Candidatus Omnitrophica bacterium]|nr:MotA/TolQ/ExbB proton channel family protein [Candidatus Omnitrophota bacterium]